MRTFLFFLIFLYDYFGRKYIVYYSSMCILCVLFLVIYQIDMKKYLGIFVLIAGMVFFVGCDKHTTILEVIDDDNLSMENEANISFDSSDVVDCDTLEKTSKGLVSKDACFRDNAIKTKNYVFCGKIENPFTRYSCYA